MGPADCRKRLQNPVWFSTTLFQRGHCHASGPRAGFGNGTGSRRSLEEGGHRGGPSSRHRVQVLQPLLHRSEEGWVVASDYTSASVGPCYQTLSVKDAHYQTDRDSNQVRGLVCHDRFQGHVLPHIHPSSTQEVPKVSFQG